LEHDFGRSGERDFGGFSRAVLAFPVDRSANIAMVHSLDGLTKWLHREEWQAGFEASLQRHVDASCAKAGIAFEELPDLLGEDGIRVIWGCVFEDYCAWEGEDGRNVVDDYLKRRGWKETVADRRYMAGLRESTMRLYEVSDIVREESFLARDLVRGGEPLRISEKSGTRSLRSWDRIAARIVPMGSKFVLGGGLLRIERETSERLLAALRDVLEVGGAPALRRSAHLFTAAWLDDTLSSVLDPKLPELHNSDGHEIVFSTARYKLERGASVVALRRALDTLPQLRRETAKFWNWITTEKPIRAAPPPESGQTFITTLDDGSTVLGTVELEGRTLALSANSRERLERGLLMLASVLKGLVGPPAVEAQTVPELMAARSSATGTASASRPSPEQERDVLHAFLDRHYERLLDDKVPSLGGLTPREAATTDVGRRKLVEWLKYLENNTERHDPADPARDYDFLWLWKRLGIEGLRR
jgi:hypothetical protein